MFALKCAVVLCKNVHSFSAVDSRFNLLGIPSTHVFFFFLWNFRRASLHISAWSIVLAVGSVLMVRSTEPGTHCRAPVVYNTRVRLPFSLFTGFRGT